MNTANTDITLRQMQSVAPAKTVAPTDPRRAKNNGNAASEPGPSFADVLGQRIAAERGPATASSRPVAAAAAADAQTSGPVLKFSAHAQTRLTSRNITWGANEAARLQAAVARAEQKGAKESLVLMDGTALVVSVKNRTVITAVDAASLKDNVFTNIDSAVIG